MESNDRHPGNQFETQEPRSQTYQMEWETQRLATKPRKCRYREYISPERCWVLITEWISKNYDFSSHPRSHILGLDRLDNIKPIDFVIFASSILPRMRNDGVDGGKSYITFCIIRILQGYCTNKKSALAIEPYMLEFTRNLLRLLKSGFHHSDVRILFNSATQVVDHMLKLVNWKGILRTVVLVAYYQLLISSLCSSDTRLELRRAMLSYMLKHLAMITPADLKTLRASVRPKLNDIYQLLAPSGDYDVQVKIVNILLRLTPRDQHPALGMYWFKHAWIFRPIHFYFSPRHCFTNFRTLLKHFNRNLGSACKVHSFKIHSVRLGGSHVDLHGEYLDDFWVDFNEDSRSVIFYSRVQIVSEGLYCNLPDPVMIFADDVQKVQLESGEINHVLTLILNYPCRYLFDKDVVGELDDREVVISLPKLSNQLRWMMDLMDLEDVLKKIYGLPVYEFQEPAPAPAQQEQGASTSAAEDETPVLVGQLSHPSRHSGEDEARGTSEQDRQCLAEEETDFKDSSSAGDISASRDEVCSSSHMGERTIQNTQADRDTPHLQAGVNPGIEKRKLAVLYGVMADDQDEAMNLSVCSRRKSRHSFRVDRRRTSRGSRSESRGRSPERKQPGFKRKRRSGSAPLTEP